jgi:hypothetical protein
MMEAHGEAGTGRFQFGAGHSFDDAACDNDGVSTTTEPDTKSTDQRRSQERPRVFFPMAEQPEMEMHHHRQIPDQLGQRCPSSSCAALSCAFAAAI